MIGLLDHFNEAPRSKQRGIKAEFAEANPPSLFELRRATMPLLRSDKLSGYSGEGE